MSYEKRILEFITGNQPCARKEIIQEFPLITPKTVYQNVRKLIEKEEVFETSLGTLTTDKGDPPVWKMPVTLRNHLIYSDISNAFAKTHPEFHKSCVALSQKYEGKLATLISDLIIIMTEVHNPEVNELRKKYPTPITIDIVELEKSFKLLDEFLNMYIEGEINFTNKK